MGMLLTYRDGYWPQADKAEPAEQEPRKPRARKAKAEDKPADE